MDFPQTTKLAFTIGRLAREGGVSIETVRFYQRRGLLDQPKKPATGGFRLYGDEDLTRLRFIKSAQQLGFSLTEIGELIDHVKHGNCDATRTLTNKKLHAIESQAEELRRVAQTLRSLVAECQDHPNCTDACPVIRKLRSNIWS